MFLEYFARKTGRFQTRLSEYFEEKRWNILRKKVRKNNIHTVKTGRILRENFEEKSDYFYGFEGTIWSFFLKVFWLLFSKYSESFSTDCNFFLSKYSIFVLKEYFEDKLWNILIKKDGKKWDRTVKTGQILRENTYSINSDFKGTPDEHIWPVRLNQSAVRIQPD